MDPHSGFNSLDYAVIAIILVSALLALMRGFVRELFSLAAWVGAYFSALRFYPLVVPQVHHYIKNDKLTELGAMAVVYVLSLVLLLTVGGMIAHFAIRGRTLTSIDRSLGFLYGLARGLVVVCLIYMGAAMILWPDIDKPPQDQPNAEQADQQPKEKGHYAVPELLIQAKTHRFMAYGSQKLAMLIPQDMLDKAMKDFITEKSDGQKEINQRTLDMLSTPAPLVHPAVETVPEHLDLNRIPNQGNTP